MSPTQHGSTPSEPIDRILEPLRRFLHVEAAGGIVLLACTVVALALANSPLGDAYDHLWQTELGVHLAGVHLVHSLEHWINGGLWQRRADRTCHVMQRPTLGIYVAAVAAKAASPLR